MIQVPRGALLPLLLVVACVACGGGDSKAAKKDEQGLKKREPARVRVAAVEQREMKRVLSTTTTVESEKEVRVFPRTSGVVTKLLVEEGDAVEEGAVLAELDARERDAQLEEARVAVREAEDAIKKAAIAVREATARGEGARLASEQALRDYERNEKANLISQAALDGLRLARDTKLSELESARLALERSQAESKASDTALEKARIVVRTRELELSYMRITAPFGGVIAERNVKVGDAVGAGAPAFVLTDALNLRAVLHRPQKELELFARAQAAKSDGRAAGLEIRAVAEALPGVTFKGAIQRVSPSIEASSGSFRVTVRLESSATEAPEKKLLPGMLVRVEVVTDRHPNALAVPKRALRREGENDILFVVRDGKARRVEVEEGYGEDLLVEVVTKHGTLAAGEQVIVVGNRELEEGGEVEFEAPVEKAASPKPSETAVAPDASPKAEKAEGASEKKEGATAPPPEAAPATSAPKQG